MEKNCFFEKNYSKIWISTDDYLPLNKPLNFPTLTIIIRCVFEEGEKLYPQIFFRQVFAWVIKMLPYHW